MKQKETPKSPMSGGKGAEVSKTLFYTQARNTLCSCSKNFRRKYLLGLNFDFRDRKIIGLLFIWKNAKLFK